MTTRPVFKIDVDPTFAHVDIFDYEFSQEIWRSKYSNNGKDLSHIATFRRVANAIASVEKVSDRAFWSNVFYDFMAAGLLMPAGRILAGAGSENLVTLVNCFVNETLEDSMVGIMDGLSKTAFTMQQGGGMGTDFSTIRPSGAHLKRTGSEASGPLPFMDMWDSMCATIMSAGSRRGAMMGTISCTHPDLLNFIDAKHKAGRMTNFNISILVTDLFMERVAFDHEWILYFPVIPAFERSQDLIDLDFIDDYDIKQYVYSKHRARDVWEKIMQSTYTYSEPGVIFIDRVNKLNNLSYCEQISCTNPCGEQPLPPYGACNLGAQNLALMVKKPFQKDAYFDFSLLISTTNVAVRFLDNVIDVSNYPLSEQATEQQDKRRIGLGISGLADVFVMMGIPYGSEKSLELAEQIMECVANQAYRASAYLAKERGTFKLHSDEITFTPFIQKLAKSIQNNIALLGLRNGVLLTIAPTGTTSVFYGNISSGMEPNFSFEYDRNVKEKDGSMSTHRVQSFVKRFWDSLTKHGDAESLTMYVPEAWVKATDLTVTQHVEMQSILQKWVDASISKTINIPTEMSYEEFKNVYRLAYDKGLKGVTTYRPSDVRGAVLVDIKTDEPKTPTTEEKQDKEIPVIKVEEPIMFGPQKRADRLSGETFKIKWPSFRSALYMTVNHSEGALKEVFFNSKDSRYQEWTTALTLSMTALFRLQRDNSFIFKEFQQITSAESAWFGGKRFDSIHAYIGFLLANYAEEVKAKYWANATNITSVPQVEALQTAIVQEVKASILDWCPECNEQQYDHSAGCPICRACGYTKC